MFVTILAEVQTLPGLFYLGKLPALVHSRVHGEVTRDAFSNR